MVNDIQEGPQVRPVFSIDDQGSPHRRFFSDLSPPLPGRSGTEGGRLLTTVVTLDESTPNGCSSTSKVAVVTPGEASFTATATEVVMPVTPTLEHVYEAAWVDEARILVASRGLPLHLYDTGGCHVASFAARDAWSDAFEQPYSAAFSEGRVVYAGSADAVYSWDIERPGKDALGCLYPQWDNEYRDVSLGGREEPPSARQRRKGDIVSSVAVDAGKHLVALGAYSGRVALFDGRTGKQEMFIEGLSNAVTQVAFHDDSEVLFVACRARGVDLYAFDMRASLGRGACLYEICRQLTDDTRSTRRVRFALSAGGRMMASGVGGGDLFKLWDVRDGSEVGGMPSEGLLPGMAAVNACCFGSGTLATAAGGFSSFDSCITMYQVY